MSTLIEKLDQYNKSSGTGNTSAKYVAVNTATLAKRFLDAGYTLRQVKGRSVEGKHVIRLSHPEMFFQGIDDVKPEIVLINNFNASGSLRIMCGLWRLVCSNGMVVGTTFEEYRIRHIGKNVERDVLIACEKIKETIPRLMNFISKAKATTLTRDQQWQLAEKGIKAAVESTGRDVNQFNVVDLNNVLRTRRNADFGDNAWVVYNRIQENVTKYSHDLQDKNTGNFVRMRPIKSAIRDVTVNRILFDQVNELIAA